MARKQLALAKISRPRLHDVLARTRLFGLLDKALERPVVWLFAQPGAGKTTLVASHLQARKRPGIWYQVDADDADPASFIYHLRLAAVAASAAKSLQRLPLLTPEYLQDLGGFARRFFRDLYAGLGPEAVLVLDNFQEVPEDSAFHRVMAEGMAQLPEGVHVLVISRVEAPAAYAPLLAGDAVASIDGAQLRLTKPETQAIARKRGVTDEALVEALFERSHGWAAGLTLMLAPTRRPAGRQQDDAEASLQHVFGYFAQRVFDGAAHEHRRALMQLAFLPQVPLGPARELTGMPEVDRLLDHYYRRHLFVDRRRVAAPQAAVPAQGIHVFQFHALFRSFLQHQARAAFGDEGCRDIGRRAALALEGAGQWEQALALFADAADWEPYGRLMAAHAEGLLAQGRHQTVADWLARMPLQLRERDPWLGYWEARALMTTQADAALRLLQDRYRQFADQGNAAGQLACGAAAVQTLWYARLGWSEITPWVDRLEPLLGAPLRFPTPAVELLSLSAMHAALAFCRPAHPAVGAMVSKLMQFVDDPQVDWNQRLSSATHLMTYLHNAAQHELANRLIATIDPLLESQPSSALNRAFWLVFRAMHDLRNAQHDQAARRFEQARELAHGEGLAHAEIAALHFHAYLFLILGRADDAQRRIAQLEGHPARRHPDGELNFFVAQTLLAQLRGDARAALDHAERGLAAVERVGATYFQAVFPVLFASALAEAGQPGRAAQIVERSRRLARGSYLEAMDAQLLLEEAYIHLVQGQHAPAQDKLAQGLALASADPTRLAYLHRIVTRKPLLLATALQAGIEVDLVRTIIRRWRMAAPRDDIAHWPWPVRVFTLGRFEVQLDDAPIEFGRKAPKKTLALLKAIIARGGSAPEAALLDMLWPDEAGDMAAGSLGAAVHRLRLLLRDADAVLQQGGQIALDRSRVWVDAWAFERALAAPAGATAPSGAAAEQSLALYQGAFLAEEEGESWPVALRERLRSKFIQAVAHHAERLEAAHKDEEAIRWYLRGLEADSVVEPFYQGLMRCYHRLDRLPEAVSAYRRLKQTLSVVLRLAPSAGTERLYKALRLEA